MPVKDFLAGELLLINKPIEWTSFDVVNKVRYALKRSLNVKKIKVGHAGTLDPLATGLLLICTGKKTKEINSFMGLDKCYEGSISLGGTTASYDLEMPLENLCSEKLKLTHEEIQKAADAFTGEIHQTPPPFSAKKIDGKKAYELARKGKEVNLAKAEISIHEFEILGVRPSEFVVGGLDCDFRVCCSKGTYIRSLAFDLGKELGTGGFLSRLVRTSVGDYSLKKSLPLDETISLIESNSSE